MEIEIVLTYSNGDIFIWCNRVSFELLKEHIKKFEEQLKKDPTDRLYKWIKKD